MTKVLILDPGESTGWLLVKLDSDEYSIISGGTMPKDHNVVGTLISFEKPDVIVYETFNMYPGKAKALSWNSFYPCEVIGVIKYEAFKVGAELVGLRPSTKKYAGGFDYPEWIKFRSSHDYTEHTKDTWLLFMYWYRNKYTQRKK